MRGLVRANKNKDKTFKGARKRKEANRPDVVGKNFKMDTTDSRFAAVFEGEDDRFGIDRTDPSFKDTDAMQQVLSEQTQRRKRARKSPSNVDVNQTGTDKSSGAKALSSLVKSLKSKVRNRS